MSSLLPPLAPKPPSTGRSAGDASLRLALRRAARGRGTTLVDSPRAERSPPWEAGAVITGGRSPAPVRTASLLVRAMSNEPGECALQIPGRENLLTWLSERLDPIHGGGTVMLIILRLCHLETIDSLAGAGARDHVLGTVGRRMLGFASARELVAHLGEGCFAFATRDSEQHGRDFASRLIDAMSRPSVFGKNLIHAPALAHAFTLDDTCGNVALHLRRAMKALNSLDSGN